MSNSLEGTPDSPITIYFCGADGPTRNLRERRNCKKCILSAIVPGVCASNTQGMLYYHQQEMSTNAPLLRGSAEQRFL